MWTGDNLDLMRGMNSESVDLIYLDPPFNSNGPFPLKQELQELNEFIAQTVETEEQ